jgi:DNA polymerase III subunit delta'
LPVPELNRILDQTEAVDFLRRTLAHGRFANAYLFYGPAGVGKGTTALAFARAILCASPGADAGPGGLFGAPAAARDVTDACGRCESCQRASRLQHPDLKFLFPVSGEEKQLDTALGETLEAWRVNPWFVFQYEKAASIRLSLTRELLRELAYKPFECSRRVVVVRDADRMREDQCSAMLKSIEEPGASTVWVLTTSRPARLPATVRSRCQKVRFTPLPESLVTSTLQQELGASPAESRMLAALSSGSLGRAIVLRDTDPLKTRNESLALLETARRGDGAGLLKAIQSVNRFGRAGRETLRRLVEFQELWLRDLLRVNAGMPRETLVNRDREPELRRLAATVSASEIRRRLLVLEEALRSIEGNVTPDLALFSALRRAADPAFETDEWPAHEAGRWRY